MMYFLKMSITRCYLKFENNPKLGIASASKQQEDYGNEIITSYVNKSFAPSGLGFGEGLV